MPSLGPVLPCRCMRTQVREQQDKICALQAALADAQGALTFSIAEVGGRASQPAENPGQPAVCAASRCGHPQRGSPRMMLYERL